MDIIKIGTRGSPLALWQANWVKTSIEKQYPNMRIELVSIKTTGDKILDTPLALVGGKGLFVKEIETALLDKSVHIAVHSMKDVPTDLPDGLEISVILKREDPRDALIARSVSAFKELPENAVIGTSSLRRQAQILHKRPDMKIVAIRGNVGTRLKKLESDDMDATILAVAGLKRMGNDKVITEYLSYTDSLPAVAQGAIGIEARADDMKTLEVIKFLNDDSARTAVEAERSFLKRLEGGCQAPIAAHATLSNGQINLDGLVGTVDGAVIHRESMSAVSSDGVALGVKLADKLLLAGADEILRATYPT